MTKQQLLNKIKREIKNAQELNDYYSDLFINNGQTTDMQDAHYWMGKEQAYFDILEDLETFFRNAGET